MRDGFGEGTERAKNLVKGEKGGKKGKGGENKAIGRRGRRKKVKGDYRQMLRKKVFATGKGVSM